MKTLIIDNYDSFTFNLYQLLAEVNEEAPVVIRNDQLRWTDIDERAFDNIVISPGPGSPVLESDFGICRDVLLKTRLPVLAVCLGHQGLGHAYRASVTHAPEVMHGRLSEIFHDGSRLFVGIPQGFRVVRYHSLLVAGELPLELVRTAWTRDNLIMGLRHRDRPLWGVQFHPESICTEYGRRLGLNFHAITRAYQRSKGRTRVDPAGRSFHALSACSVVPPDAGSGRRADATVLQVHVRRLTMPVDCQVAFVRLFGEAPFAFWLDSSRAESGLARFSFMGAPEGPRSKVVEYDVASHVLTAHTPQGTQTANSSVFDYLKRELAAVSCEPVDLPFDFAGGFVGYFGYELKAECGGQLVHRSSVPDAMFMFVDRFIAVDHAEGVTYLVSLADPDERASALAWIDATAHRLETAIGDGRDPGGAEESGPTPFVLSRDHEQYLADIASCQRHLRDGETYEVCLTNRLKAAPVSNPLGLYRALRHINPAPYAAFLRFGDRLAILSSSPERFLRIERDGWVEAKPIKGTRRRGATDQEDSSLRIELATSEKDRSENLMIVDLLRNDLGLVCEIGSVHVPKLMDVESYATVHQLVSTIRGKLRPGLTAVDCIKAAFPGGSMTGAPKVRTLQIIDELEGEARGIYSGALGYLAIGGAVDLSIVIRTVVNTPNVLEMGVGGAVVALSDPEEEFDEILLKAGALMKAVTAVRGSAGSQPVVGHRGLPTGGCLAAAS